jgi:hypothetical protein
VLGGTLGGTLGKLFEKSFPKTLQKLLKKIYRRSAFRRPFVVYVPAETIRYFFRGWAIKPAAALTLFFYYSSKKMCKGLEKPR